VSARRHRAARLEDAARGAVTRYLRGRGWTPRALPFAGYGSRGRVRVLARVLLCPPGSVPRSLDGVRGWRRFASAAAGGVPVEVTVGSCRETVVSGRGGYLDVVLDAGATHAPTVATLTVGSSVSYAPLFLVPDHARLGVVSDVDDTVMITALPRPLLALWNTFVRHESARRPVPGMAGFYREILRRDPETFVVYLSTGPWNVAPALTTFLERHGFPPGPLLMTDWGPTSSGWFRSGPAHKRTQLGRLMHELPQLTWLLVGDDGQHDPVLYREAADAAPGRVRAIAIRQLTASQQLLAHGTITPLPGTDADSAPAPGSGSGSGSDADAAEVPTVYGTDGDALWIAVRDGGVLDSPA